MQNDEENRFVKKIKVTPKENSATSMNIPDGFLIKCQQCGKNHFKEEFILSQHVCQKCGYHGRLTAKDRIEQILDENTFEEFDANLYSKDPLSFPQYKQKLHIAMEKTGINEAVITGRGKISGTSCCIDVMDTGFMMASMGSVVGEKITRLFEYATEKQLPVVIFTASGGARMHEGIISLMQMAKTSAAAAKHSESGNLYITVLTDPTTGGVTASFAMLGDIILAEPGATIGFAGRRVIEQTIQQELPQGFQTAEFLLEHGFIDKIVPRSELKSVLGFLIYLHSENMKGVWNSDG